MSQRIQCDKCGAKINVPDGWPRPRARCPRCTANLTVPGHTASAEALEATPTLATQRWRLAAIAATISLIAMSTVALFVWQGRSSPASAKVSAIDAEGSGNPLPVASAATQSLTPGTEQEFRHLVGLTGLERLSLSGSPVTGAGLRHLRTLPHLKVLNLRGTDVRDGDLAVLADFPALTDIATPQTRVTAAGVRSIEVRRPNLLIRASRPDELTLSRSINPGRRPEYMTTDPSPKLGPLDGPPIFPDGSR
jgi:hypothetical protein